MMVRVWRYQLFDIETGKYAEAPGYETVDAIARAKGVAILRSDALVDASLIDDQGLTPPNFHSSPESG
jgi:hypothetical protein